MPLPFPIMIYSIKRFLRFAAWVAAGGLALASWTPAQDMIRTGANGLLEHTAAYLITGVAFMMAYDHRPPWHFALALSIYAALLEMGQMIAPGRHAGILDWAAGMIGAAGAAAVMIASRILMKRSAGEIRTGNASSPPSSTSDQNIP